MAKEQRVKHSGKQYRLIVGLITSRDEKGRPKTITLGYDDTKFTLEGGEQFMTLFAPVNMTNPTTN